MRNRTLIIGQLEKPTIMRRQITSPVHQAQASQPIHQPAPQPVQQHPRSIPAENIHDIDYLDIPAFLRRKEEEMK